MATAGSFRVILSVEITACATADGAGIAGLQCGGAVVDTMQQRHLTLAESGIEGGYGSGRQLVVMHGAF